MMKDEFNEYTWHDAVLWNVRVDRTDPGHSDSVELLIQRPDGEQIEVRFRNCYLLRCTMNFGVVALETIRSFSELVDGEDVALMRTGLAWLGSNLSKVRYFRLETNSTASTILIASLYAEIGEPWGA